MVEGVHCELEHCRDRLVQELTLRKIEERVNKSEVSKWETESVNSEASAFCHVLPLG